MGDRTTEAIRVDSTIDLIGSFDQQIYQLARADTVEAKVGRALALAQMEQAKQARIANLIALRAQTKEPDVLADLDLEIAEQLGRVDL